MAAVHLTVSYCVPSLLYGCELWTLTSSAYHKMNFIWNNVFRKIFQCCWREKVSCLLYYCKVPPLSYIITIIIDQRKMLFLQKMKNCDNSIVRTLSTLDMCVGKLMSKHSMQKLCRLLQLLCLNNAYGNILWTLQ